MTSDIVELMLSMAVVTLRTGRGKETDRGKQVRLASVEPRMCVFWGGKSVFVAHHAGKAITIKVLIQPLLVANLGLPSKPRHTIYSMKKN